MLYNGNAANGGPRNAADAVFYTRTYGQVLHRRFLQTPAHTLGLHNQPQQSLAACLDNRKTRWQRMQDSQATGEA